MPGIFSRPMALLLLVLWGACEKRQPESLTFRYQLPAPPKTLDPARTGYIYDLGIIDRIFDGLMRLDRAHNVPVPELAESYEVLEAGRVYEFRLADARFHNNQPVRASDVKYSWERVLAPGTRSPGDRFLDLIEGADAYRAGQADSVRGIEIEEPDLVRIRLREPFAPFLYHLTHPSTSIVPREEVEALRERFGQQPVGSGPYRFRNWENGPVVLESFDTHPRHPPQVKRLIYEFVPDGNEAMRRYQAGELDLVSQLPPGSLRSLQQIFPADLRIFPSIAWYGFSFRGEEPPFDDSRVRRAFALAVDRDALVEELGEIRHTAAIGFLPQVVPGHDPATLSSGYDLEEARALLAEAGYPEGVGIAKLVFATRKGALDEQVAQFLVDAFGEIGVVAEYASMDASSLQAGIMARRFAVFRFGWAGEYPDPDPYLRPLFHSESSWYHNREVDRLLDAARTEPDALERRDLYHQAESLIIDDAPCVTLYQTTEAILLRPHWQNVPLGHHPVYFEIEHARRRGMKPAKEDS